MFTGPKEVVVKRIPRVGYFGITSYAKSVATLCAQISKNGYKTGLTPEEETYYEGKLGLKPGELNKHSEWWSEVFNVIHAPKLFNTKKTDFVLDNPLNQIRYKVLLASARVANSEIEKNDPNAEFYIIDEEAKAKKENEIFDYEFEAYELVMKLSPEDKKGALKLFGIKGVDTFSDLVIKAELGKKIKANPKLFVDTLKDKRLKTKIFIEELIEYNLLKRQGNYYIHNEDTIATSTEECIEYFDDIKNQSVKLVLDTRLKKSKKGKE